MKRMLTASLLLCAVSANAQITPETEREINALLDRWNDYKNNPDPVARTLKRYASANSG